MYATYHMTNPLVFYNKEDQWQWPVLESGQNSQPMQPYYTIMTLPGETKTEFIQMLPFTPRAKDNLAAWMVARSDAEHYGQLARVPVPEAENRLRSAADRQGRINQDQVISPQITLWNQQGSQVIWGTLLVIPIERVADLRAAALSPIAAEQHSGAEARHRGLPEPDRDGRDAHAVLWRRSSAATSRRPSRRISSPARPHRSFPTAGLPRRSGGRAASACGDRPARRWPPRPRRTSTTPRRRSAPATGRLYGEEMRKVRDVLERMQRAEMTDTGGAVKERVKVQKEGADASTRSSCSTTTTRRWSSWSRC